MHFRLALNLLRSLVWPQTQWSSCLSSLLCWGHRPAPSHLALVFTFVSFKFQTVLWNCTISKLTLGVKETILPIAWSLPYAFVPQEVLQRGLWWQCGEGGIHQAIASHLEWFSPSLITARLPWALALVTLTWTMWRWSHKPHSRTENLPHDEWR